MTVTHMEDHLCQQTVFTVIVEALSCVDTLLVVSPGLDEALSSTGTFLSRSRRHDM